MNTNGDGFDFICLNEENGLECDYPFCDCENKWIEENFELPSMFDRASEDEDWFDVEDN